MLTAACPPKYLPAMIRSALLPVAILACMLCADAAGAQDSPSELVTRIDRLEAVIRNLTGNIEQLQYHNQQLEQQVQRLQAEVQAGTPPVTSAAPPRPTAQYSPPARHNPAGSGGGADGFARLANVAAAAIFAASRGVRTGGHCGGADSSARADRDATAAIDDPPRRCVRPVAEPQRARCAAPARRQHGRNRAAASGRRGARRASNQSAA